MNQRSYPIVEVFTSIQGEGVHMGILTTFVRFAGCNLACSFCDTKESWDITKATMMTVDEIVALCPTERVVLTGGEPTLYELKDLIDALHDSLKRRKVAIETNGTRGISQHWHLDWITCSPKSPEFAVQCRCDELKYVVTDDFDPNVICWNGVSRGRIFLQPESHRAESMKRAYGLALQYPNYLRVGIQLHKVMEVK